MNLNLKEPHVSGITQNMSFYGWLTDGIVIKNLPAMQNMQETRVQSLGWEDPLGKEMAYPHHYSGLGNPMNRRAWRAAVHGVTESDMTEHTHTPLT